jgi:hypothetical protein
MNLKHNITGRLVLFVAFVSIVFITSSVGQTHSGAESGRLIVYRASSFGSRLALQLKIDGRTVGSITQGQNYDGFIPAGHHELTVRAVPRGAVLRNQTSISLDVRPGHTYAFTAVWESDQIFLRRSRQPTTARLR